MVDHGPARAGGNDERPIPEEDRETWECPECGFRGNREQAAWHVEECCGCVEFRVLTHAVDAEGQVVDRSTEKRPASVGGKQAR